MTLELRIFHFAPMASLVLGMARLPCCHRSKPWEETVNIYVDNEPMYEKKLGLPFCYILHSFY